MAASLRRDGDVEGANAVLHAAGTNAEDVVAATRMTQSVVEWYEPEDMTDELVLDDGEGDALRTLRDSFACIPKMVERGIDAPSRVLFVGPSGVGKTTAARWLGGELRLPVAVAKIHGVVGGHIGESSGNLAKAFGEACTCPSILMLDEIDGLVTKRASGDGSAAQTENNRTISSFLQQLDMLPPSQIVIAATNLPEMLDPALLRRLSTKIAFGFPSDAARTKMVARWLRLSSYNESALELLVRRGRGKSGAELRDATMRAARAAILDGDKPIQPTHVDPGYVPPYACAGCKRMLFVERWALCEHCGHAGPDRVSE